MGVRSLISFGLFLIPIAVTIGVLVGLDAYRNATGGPPLFGGGGSGGIGSPGDNRVTAVTFCDQAYGIHPPSRGEEYTLNPNPWNWEKGEEGALCLHVDQNNNGSYASDTTAPAFYVTWNYPRGPSDDPVHAFPNIKLDTSGIFPVQLSNINNINISTEWHYGLGDVPVESTDVAAVTAGPTCANVAFDIFIDPDRNTAQDAGAAKYEVMVWLGYFEPNTARPAGTVATPTTTLTVDGYVFTLYYGATAQGRDVLTWYPSTIVQEFTADLMTFITATLAATNTNAQVPTSSDYLGYVGMGSEAFYALQNVTFSVPKLSMQVVKN